MCAMSWLCTPASVYLPHGQLADVKDITLPVLRIMISDMLDDDTMSWLMYRLIEIT